MSAVLVARFEGRSEVAPIVRAALDEDIVYLPLPEPPPPGRHTLQLWIAQELIAAVSAELVGSRRGTGEYPLRVHPLDPAHVPELEALGERRSVVPASAAPVGPRPSRKSIREAAGEDVTLSSAGSGAEDRTLTSRTEDRTLVSSAAPSGSERLSQPDASEVESAATTIFDPDGLLRAPAPNTGTASDDQTLPRSPVSAGAPAATRREVFSDEESQTLPGQSTRTPGSSSASWNVRQDPTTKDPLCGRMIAGGKYTLDSIIGTGAIGIVFKASHRDLGRTVAIKVLNPRYRDDPELLDIFRTEARAASLLEHPNVARVYDYGQEPDGLVYIVMEYLSGYTLGSVLGARRKLTPVRAVDVMIQVCAALSAAHDRGIVHRDVKPDNVVLVPAQDDEGKPVEVVKVCDFGIAALGTTRMEEGVAAGTPEYMAPEQTTGSAVTPAADVYACGIVLYEMLAGEVPFSADQAFRILMKHRSEEPRPLSALTAGLSPALEAVVMRCVEKRPERRFQSARELRVELRKVADAKL